MSRHLHKISSKHFFFVVLTTNILYICSRSPLCWNCENRTYPKPHGTKTKQKMNTTRDSGVTAAIAKRKYVLNRVKYSNSHFSYAWPAFAAAQTTATTITHTAVTRPVNLYHLSFGMEFMGSGSSYTTCIYIARCQRKMLWQTMVLWKSRNKCCSRAMRANRAMIRLMAFSVSFSSATEGDGIFALHIYK